MNIGVLGGTFDPPHDAHLRIAERSIEQFTLDKVIFIPSGNPWQKQDATSYLHRYEMTKILIADSNNLEISDIENSEENPSYTYETLKKLNHPKEELFFILGSPLSFEHPELKGFNFKGGLVIRPEFIAMFLALSIYTAAFISEIVRAGIMSVSKGSFSGIVPAHASAPSGPKRDVITSVPYSLVGLWASSGMQVLLRFG